MFHVLFTVNAAIVTAPMDHICANPGGEKMGRLSTAGTAGTAGDM